MTNRPARIALVGDRSPQVLAHDRIPIALRHVTSAPDPYWISSGDVRDVAGLTGFDGIWLVPGSPYADRDGALAAVMVARTAGVPFLGTCGGFQHALLEFARSVTGLDVDHAENPSGGADHLIVPLSCSLLGEEARVDVLPGTRAADLLGAGPRVERFFCSYGLDARFRARLEGSGLVFSAFDETGNARMVELPGHPFFLASLFQPELSSDETWVHPLIRAFVGAAVDRVAGGRGAGSDVGSDVDREPTGADAAVVVPASFSGGQDPGATQSRTRAAGTAIASLKAEGLVPSSSALDVVAVWRDGGLSTTDALVAVKEAHDVK